MNGKTNGMDGDIILPPLLWEAINVLLSILLACMVLIFSRYFLAEIVSHGFRRARLRAGIGLFVTMAGDLLTRGWAAAGRHFQNNDIHAAWMGQMPWALAPLIGAIICAIGLLCLIRVFSPDEWGSWGWIVCAVVAIAATVFSVGF